MHKHKFTYPDRLINCQFCDGVDIELEAGIYRLEDNTLTALFNMKCLKCGYSTAFYEGPDHATQAWNLSKKLEINKLLKSVQQEKK